MLKLYVSDHQRVQHPPISTTGYSKHHLNIQNSYFIYDFLKRPHFPKNSIIPNCTMSFFGVSRHRSVLRTSAVAQTDHTDKVSRVVPVRATGYAVGSSRGHQPCKQREYWFSPSTNMCTFKYSLSILFTPSPSDELFQYYQ